MQLQWTSDMQTGIKEIDDQHLELLIIVNKILESYLSDKNEDKAGLPGTLHILEDHMLKHFSTEERLMRKHNFPGYRSHKEMHDSFWDKFDILKFKLTKKFDEDIKNKVGKTVSSWWGEHINIDKELAVFLMENRI